MRFLNNYMFRILCREILKNKKNGDSNFFSILTITYTTLDEKVLCIPCNSNFCRQHFFNDFTHGC